MRTNRRGSSVSSSEPSSAAVQVRRAVARVQLHVHAVGLDPADLLDGQQPHAIRSAHHEPIERPSRRLRRRAAAARPGSGAVEERLQLRHHRLRVSGADVAQRVVERGLELLVAERLEQVGDRVRVERAQRVLVVRGHEDDFGHRHRRPVAHERGEHAEAVELRHLDVEEHQLHGSAGLRGRAQDIERFGAARAAAGELHPVVARQQPPQPLASRLLVVHDQRAGGPHAGVVHGRAAGSATCGRPAGGPGTSICTSTPPVATGTSFSRSGRPVDVFEAGRDVPQPHAGVPLEAPLRGQPHAIVAHANLQRCGHRPSTETSTRPPDRRVPTPWRMAFSTSG